MKETQMPPVHAANLVANNGNTAYGVEPRGTPLCYFASVSFNFD